MGKKHYGTTITVDVAVVFGTNVVVLLFFDSKVKIVMTLGSTKMSKKNAYTYLFV